MPSVERAGATVWYEDRGPRDGECVLLIHGGFYDPMDGERFWIAPGVVDDLVAAGYRCLVPDRRFCGGRTTADFDWHSFGADANDAIEVLDAEKISQAHIVAGSNGCSVALILAAKQIGRSRSLILCWPAIQDNTLYNAAVLRSADALREMGTAAYLDMLRADGLPRLHEERPGWPFGVALLRDDRTAATFLKMDTTWAAHAIEGISWFMANSHPLRQIDDREVWKITNARIPTFVVPPEPEDPFHDRATAEMLVNALPGGRMLAGAPITPSTHFPAYRASFVETLIAGFSTTYS